MIYRLLPRLTAAVALFGLCMTTALAQKTLSHEQRVAHNNNITINVVAGKFDDISARLANELAVVLDQPDELRILPVLTGGGTQNISDVLYLSGVDIGFVRTDVLTYAKNDSEYAGAVSRLRYISKLHNEQVYVVTASAVGKMADLAGLPVNFGRYAEGNTATPKLILEALGIEVQPTYLDHAEAITRIKAGEIAATILVNAHSSELLASLRAEDGLKLLSIEYTDKLHDMYLPSSLTSEDYPALIAKGKTIDTLATSVAMIMYDWPKGHSRYKRVDRFVKAFFSKLSELRKPSHHPKWREVNLTAAIPGWERFEPAEDWVSLYGTTMPGKRALTPLKVKFEKFLKSQQNGGGQALSEAQRDEMFRIFLGWKENQTAVTIQVYKTSKTGIGRFVGTIRARNTEINLAGTKERALLLRPKLSGLRPGRHAFDLYAEPNCGPAAKGNVMVAGLGAGTRLFAEQEGRTYDSHLGDLPDLEVARDGTASEDILVPRLSLADLLNRSIVVHANSKNTSPRRACGVIN